MLAKKLRPIGNSIGIIVPKQLLDLTGADENTVYRFELQGEDIVLKKVSTEELREYARKKSRSLLKKQSSVFKKLAE